MGPGPVCPIAWQPLALQSPCRFSLSAAALAFCALVPQVLRGLVLAVIGREFLGFLVGQDAHNLDGR